MKKIVNLKHPLYENFHPSDLNKKIKLSFHQTIGTVANADAHFPRFLTIVVN